MGQTGRDRKDNEQVKKDPNLIPPGFYCYTPREGPCEENNWVYKVNPCPYWSKQEGKPEQADGYCSFLEKGDWEEDGTMLLWDQVKECGINDELDPNDLLELEDCDK